MKDIDNKLSFIEREIDRKIDCSLERQRVNLKDEYR